MKKNLYIVASLLVSSVLTFFLNTAYSATILQDLSNQSISLRSIEPAGQTFTAEDAKIDSIGFELGSSQLNITMSLYEGEGTGGNLIATGSVVRGDGSTFIKDWVDVDFSSINLTVGNRYTAVVSRNNSELTRISAVNVSGLDAYPSGTAVIRGSPVTGTIDMRFRVIMGVTDDPVSFEARGKISIISGHDSNGLPLDTTSYPFQVDDVFSVFFTYNLLTTGSPSQSGHVMRYFNAITNLSATVGSYPASAESGSMLISNDLPLGNNIFQDIFDFSTHSPNIIGDAIGVFVPRTITGQVGAKDGNCLDSTTLPTIPPNNDICINPSFMRIEFVEEFPDPNAFNTALLYAQSGPITIRLADEDGDDLRNDVDNCPTVFNPDQTQTGNNVGTEFGDACVSPDVVIPGDADVGSGTTIGSGSDINSGVSIGDDSSIGEGVTLNQGVAAGDGVSIDDSSSVNKGTSLGDESSIGANVVIGKNCSIGERVKIGDSTILGQNCIIGDDSDIGLAVTIEKDVTVLPSTVIPDGAVIGKGLTVPPLP